MSVSGVFEISRDNGGSVTSIRCNDVNQQGITLASRSGGQDKMCVTEISEVQGAPNLTCIRGCSNDDSNGSIKREFILRASTGDVVKVLADSGFEKPEITEQKAGSVGDAVHGTMKHVFS